VKEMLGQRENTITRSTGRFCLNQDNNKTKGRSQVVGMVKPRSDNDTGGYRSVHQEKGKKKKKIRMSFDKSSW
jgi:hypothetical protein